MYRGKMIKISGLALLVSFFTCVGNNRTDAQRPITPKELEQLADNCREIWFESKDDLTLGERMQLFDSLEANRKLSTKEMECILRWSDLLIDKKARGGTRTSAARFLGDLGHKYGIPPLLAVLRDENDSMYVRMWCIVGLSHIADDRVVAPMIDVLAEREEDISSLAEEKLVLITRARMPRAENWADTPANSPEREQLQTRWRQWWNTHREKMTPDRANSYANWPPEQIYTEEDFPLEEEPQEDPGPANGRRRSAEQR